MERLPAGKAGNPTPSSPARAGDWCGGKRGEIPHILKRPTTRLSLMITLPLAIRVVKTILNFDSRA